MAICKICCASLLLSLFLTISCHGSFIGSLEQENIMVSLGENGAAYFGQSFVAPNGFLTNLKFKLGSAGGPGDSPFRVLITEVVSGPPSNNRYGYIAPTTILFESSTLVLPYLGNSNPTTTTEFSVSLPQLSLTPGNTYGFVLDAFSDFDGVQNFMSVASNDNYEDGDFFYYGIGFQAGDTGQRLQHFGDMENWITYRGFYNQDIAFQLSFESSPPVIPEPATSTLTVIGAITCLALLRTRTIM